MDRHHLGARRVQGVAVLSAWMMSRPIGHLMDGARRIGTGALDHRIQITSRDELGELAEEFNIMAAKLQELDQMKQDFVSNVTHELRSPLTSLRGYVEFLMSGSAGPHHGRNKSRRHLGNKPQLSLRAPRRGARPHRPASRDGDGRRQRVFRRRGHAAEKRGFLLG